MKSIYLLILQLIALLFLSVQPTLGQKFKPSFKESRKTTHPISKDQDYTFGYLEVLENRESNSNKTIKIPVYLFKSRSNQPKKDPIIYTVGGPGNSTMPSAQYMKFYQYLDDRDFILLEQRGTTYAKPHLDCPEWAEAVYLSNQPDFDQKQYDAVFAQAAKDCRKRLSSKDIDLNAYTTRAIAADIADLVEVLNIEAYNLLTISYSTKIAQVLMRDYPDKIRSVVMDSALPLEVNYDEESVKNLLQSFKSLLNDCQQQDSCNSAYPRLWERFSAYLKEKTEHPLEVKIKHPKTDKLVTFYLKGEDLMTVFSSASTNDFYQVPYEVNKLLNNDLSSVKEQLTYLFAEPNSGAGRGMRLSVWCAEEYPFNSQQQIQQESKAYPEVKGLSPATFSKEVCEIWSVKREPASENLPVSSDIPVLLINGGYDYNTPVKWANAMHSRLPNSFQLVFPYWGHTPTTNWSNTCAMEAANAFFNDPYQKPQAGCLEELAEQKFYVE